MPSDLITKLRDLYPDRDSAYDAGLKAQAADRLELYEREALDLRERISALQLALATDQERTRRYERALRAVPEWVSLSGWRSRRCLVCGAYDDAEHVSTCKLAAALKAMGEG